MSLSSKDLAGYRGKEIEVFVCNDVDASPGDDGDEQVYTQVRGAQNFNTSEERPSPDQVAEMGYEVTKAIYGPVTYGLSIEMLVRDLVHIARLSGINPTSAKKLNVEDFEKTNTVAYYRDPDSAAINLTKIVSGFKARTASTPMAVGANTSVTLDGAADMASFFDGKANVVQYVQSTAATPPNNGRDNDFEVPVAVVTEIYQVEKGEGVLVDQYSLANETAGWEYTNTDADSGSIKFLNASGVDTDPDENAVIRIVYKVT